MISVRQAGVLDARPMAELLNEIVAQGGTTALTDPKTVSDMTAWMTAAPGQSSWVLAEDEAGQVMGFQALYASDALPAEAGEIATFARVGRTGLGIGTLLFEQTKIAAKKLGFAWINANIRADNFGGLAYYQSRGFEDYGRKKNVVLTDGTRVDKVLKRYDLT